MKNNSRIPAFPDRGTTGGHLQVLLFAAAISIGASAMLLALSGGTTTATLSDASSLQQAECQSGGETNQAAPKQNCLAAKSRSCNFHLLTREQYVNCLAANRAGLPKQLDQPNG